MIWNIYLSSSFTSFSGNKYVVRSHTWKILTEIEGINYTVEKWIYIVTFIIFAFEKKNASTENKKKDRGIVFDMN